MNVTLKRVGRSWPKRPPELTVEQERAREAFVAVWHQQLPTRYAMIERFNHGSIARLPIKKGANTLEIGAGLGAHSRFEDLTRQDYYCLEYREEFCKTLVEMFPANRVVCGDIEQRQPWLSGFFDRIIAIHVLEHLRNLPAALAEIRRLLKPDGFFDVVVPCEGDSRTPPRARYRPSACSVSASAWITRRSFAMSTSARWTKSSRN